MSLTEVTHNGSGASQGMEIQLYFEHKPDDPVLVTVLMTMFFLWPCPWCTPRIQVSWRILCICERGWGSYNETLSDLTSCSGLDNRISNLGCVILGMNKHLFLANANSGERRQFINMTPIFKYWAKLFSTLCSISSEMSICHPLLLSSLLREWGDHCDQGWPHGSCTILRDRWG